MDRIGHVVQAALVGFALLSAPAARAAQYGPYNGDFPRGGDWLAKPARVVPGPDGAWSLSGWIQAEAPLADRALVAGVGAPGSVASHYLALEGGKASLVIGDQDVLVASVVISAGQWHQLTAVSDVTGSRLYVDGREAAHGAAQPGFADDGIGLAPRNDAVDPQRFAGRVAGFTVFDRALTAGEIKTLSRARPDPVLTVFESGSPTWPVQVRQMYGQVTPQDAWTRPKTKAVFDKPIAKPEPSGPILTRAADGGWTLGGWRLAEAPKVTAQGAALSQPGYDAKGWYAATVPGTVLTTLVDRGVYPDPEHGLNNTVIPESLNRQDYWYRTEFTPSAELDGRHAFITFKGVNYAAEVWLNGQRLGDVRGAFIRGRFEVTGRLRPGQANALAVKVSPPPHPGIAHEESLTAGVGENGGMEALDGPTFVASEGWDWIPSVRDRNTGLWQDVVLSATGPVTLGDPQVITTLPRADNSQADVEIDAPVANLSDHPVQARLHAAFDDVNVDRTVTLAPGQATIALTPADFPQLSVARPRLWWPNGYGEPALHSLRLKVSVDGATSDTRTIRFGMRQITYELSLMTPAGELRRVEVDFARARQLGQDVVDVSHEAIRKVPGGWVESLRPGAEASPAVHPLSDDRLTPYLVLRVNGVRVAARGGNWGTDDWLKRVSRARLEPYFRLHRDAHLNIIRNWVGQNTEDVFYDLADEYGLLVLNDFWASTQDYQLEPQDVPLFLANAADVIARYRNHPSIALWFGRNEGVPQPVLNEGLEKLVHDLDGTRWYTGSSNRIELQDSGPYSYKEPETYFTAHAKGFSVESGTPSFPTLEAFEAAVPAADRWPIGDVWAYHDWHQTGNGAVGSFMQAMDDQFGAATSLEDFERKAQMMNYVTHRAMFEGFNAELWTKTSGRLLWMTQPAWPSTMWQILSHDYDTHAAFYGVMKAAEPIHVQMNLPDFALAVVNNTTTALIGLTLRAQVYALDNRPLAARRQSVDAAADGVTTLAPLALQPLLATEGVVLVRLELTDAAGRLLSQNLYWQGRDRAAYRKLNDLPPQAVTVSADSRREGGEVRVRVRLRNAGPAPALAVKLTLEGKDGARILPAYASDNYVSLLPGESRDIDIAYPAAAPPGPTVAAVRGWNTPAAIFAVKRADE